MSTQRSTGQAGFDKKLERAMQHQRANEWARAEELYRQILRKEPRHVAALHLLGALLLQNDRDDEAARLLERAVAGSPHHALLLANLGEAYRRIGRVSDAAAVLSRAIRLKPDLAEARYTLGLVLQRQGKREEAIVEFRRATQLKPALLKPHVKLAAALHDMGRLDEALRACRRGLGVESRCPDFHNQQGLVLRDQGRIAEALASFAKALQFETDFAPAHSNLVYALALDPNHDPQSIAAEAVRWAEVHAAPLAGRCTRHSNDADPDRRLRVGYVSPHFYNHCHCLFLLPLFERHDRDQVEVFAYGSVERPDDITERVRARVDHYIDVASVDDARVVDRIRADRIDILVDLAMHLPGGRLRIFALKPAPVQVTWLAYPGTTGVDAIDYRMTDVHLDPPGAPDRGAYVERSVRLPETFWCYDPMTGELDVSPLPAAENGHVTFGCLNSFTKTNPQVFAVWARILRAVDGSRLVLVARPGEVRERTRAAFAAQGVDPERLEIVDYRPRTEYLALYRGIDLCLDTFPHNGGTTSLDAAWMGVPVVTLVGATAVGRAGLCIASNLGLPDVVARTPEEYVAIAIKLAHDVSWLARSRSELRGKMKASPLMDAPRFARNLEAAYRTMWRAWVHRGDGPS